MEILLVHINHKVHWIRNSILRKIFEAYKFCEIRYCFYVYTIWNCGFYATNSRRLVYIILWLDQFLSGGYTCRTTVYAIRHKYLWIIPSNNLNWTTISILNLWWIFIPRMNVIICENGTNCSVKRKRRKSEWMFNFHESLSFSLSNFVKVLHYVSHHHSRVNT